MQVSSYNFYLDKFQDKGYGIVYNTNSGTIIAIHDKHIWNCLLDGKTESIPSSDLNALIDNKICVLSHFEEFAEIKNRYLQKTRNSDTLFLTIMPTEACNFACPYCFLWEKKAKTMQDSTYTDILTYISNSIKSKSGLRHIMVNWFGGEPSLCADQICAFMPKISALSSKYDISVDSSITTNGYLLNADMFKKLVSVGVSYFQVTVDGTKDTHNLGRPHKTNPDSYSVIMENLENIHAIPDLSFSMDIRCNFTRATISSVDAFIDIFGKKFANDPRFHLYCRPVYEYETKENTVQSLHSDILSLEEGIIQQNIFSQKISDLTKETTKRRMVDPLPQPTPCWCNAEREDSIVIGADGSIYLCDTLTGDDKAIGKLVNGCVSKNQNSLSKYNIFDDKRTQKCMECKLLPICMGGCLRNRLSSDAECYWSACGIQAALEKYYG